MPTQIYGSFTHEQIHNLFHLYCHVKKRLADEFGIELDSAWEGRVNSGELDVPLPFDDARYRKMELALRNVSMSARRLLASSAPQTQKATESMQHILRFCEEACITSSVLRTADLKVSDIAVPYGRI